MVYDTVGGLDHYQRSLPLLKPGGMYISIVGDAPSHMSVSKVRRVRGGGGWGLGRVTQPEQHGAAVVYSYEHAIETSRLFFF